MKYALTGCTMKDLSDAVEQFRIAADSESGDAEQEAANALADVAGLIAEDQPLDALYLVASDDETNMLDDLVIRAGLRWQCACDWVNPSSAPMCESGCGRGKSAQ